MEYANYHPISERNAKMAVTVNGVSTPVWLQTHWDAGEYAFYIRRNGCGHCCAAMAARLHGVELDPHKEYELCRKLWGPPKELPDDKGQDHFQSMAGIVKVLQSLGIPAVCFGVKEQGAKAAVEHMMAALFDGKQVIFASDPDDYPDNPFSSGYHWVMAVGFAAEGQILIANSSAKAVPDGIQLVTPEIIERALFRESVVAMDLTWGELERLYEGCGYIVVG